jgi:hypothetical protein
MPGGRVPHRSPHGQLALSGAKEAYAAPGVAERQTVKETAPGRHKPLYPLRERP